MYMKLNIHLKHYVQNSNNSNSKIDRR